MARDLNDTRARQGTRGSPILVVLGASMALAVLALLGYAVWFSNESPSTTGSTPNPSTDAPLNSPANPASPIPADRDVNKPGTNPR